MEHHDRELALLAELLPNVSAQLRGPLGNLYMAFSRIATPERRAEDPELDRNAALVQQSYYRLLRLAGNLTYATRLLERAPLPLQNLDLAVVAENLCYECRPLVELAGRRLTFRAEGAPIIIALHRESVQRILLHLLSNALKFSPQGSEIVVYCRRSAAQALLTVQDQGPGIPEEKLARLLEPQPLASQPESAPHGLGMGLPLARALADSMGGRLLLENTPVGTAATLALPMRQTACVARDISFSYTGGFSTAMVELSDGLPPEAFLQESATRSPNGGNT